MIKKKLEVPTRVWKDKNIHPDGKTIYAYLYAKGLDKIIIHLNVGELGQCIPITNVGLRKNQNILQKFKYLMFKEYDKGMYEIHMC